MDQAQGLRGFTGWSLRGIVRNSFEATKTHLPLDEEYWLALRHPAEVESAGLTLLTVSNPQFAVLQDVQQKQAWREFRAYVRQAEGFYRGACVLPWKSSPLNYYYSFMNLVKALAVARGVLLPQPGRDPRVLQHGLSARVVAGPPDSWRLVARGADGLFSLFYRLMVGVPIPDNTELDTRRLLGYVSPIGWQLAKSGGGATMGWFACKWVIVTDSAAGCWDIIAVPRDADIARLPAGFDAAYEEIPADAAKAFAFAQLNLHAAEANEFRFLQRKVPIPSPAPNQYDVATIERLLKECAGDSVFEYLGGMDYQFALGMPYAVVGGNVPMNECVASYAVMYFLSSLVRYHPDYMDSIGESNDAWLIESFAKSTPLSLVRYFVSAILGYTLLIESA